MSSIVSVQEGQDVGMGNLIPIRQDGEALWVDARMLHLALGAAAKFADWITRRLPEVMAVEGEDFFSELRKTSGRPSIGYQITLDLAKEIAMLERTERGKAIRRYFIDAEKQLRAGGPTLAPAPALPTDPIELLELSLRGIQQTRQDVRELQATTTALTERLDNTPILMHPEMEATIYALCQELALVIPGGYRAAYRAFKSKFGAAGIPLAKYSSLPASRFPEGCGYLRGLIAQHSRGRLIEAGA